MKKSGICKFRNDTRESRSQQHHKRSCILDTPTCHDRQHNLVKNLPPRTSTLPNDNLRKNYTSVSIEWKIFNGILYNSFMSLDKLITSFYWMLLATNSF